jgi:aconitate hydratase
MAHQREGSLVVGGSNYGQGSSREHAALAPRHLGVKAVLAKSFARIHWQNLINFGILPLTFQDPGDCGRIEQGDEVELPEVRARLRDGNGIEANNRAKGQTYLLEHQMTPRQVEMVLAGGIIPLQRTRALSPA